MSDAATQTTTPSTSTNGAPPPAADDGGDWQANLARQVDKARASGPAEPADEKEAGKQPPASGDDSPADSASAKGDEKDAGKDAKEAKDGDEEKSPPPDKDPKVAAKFAALAKRAERIRQKGDEVDRKASQVAEREQRVSQYEQHLAEREKNVRAIEEALRDEQSALAYFQQRGMSMERITSAAMAERDPALRAELEAKRGTRDLEAMRKEIADLRAERDRHQKESEQRAHEATIRAAETEFLRIAGEEKHESAQLAYSEEEQLRIAYHLDKLARAKGLRWSLADIAQAMTELAEQGQTINSRGEVVKNTRWEKLRSRLAPTARGAAPATAASTSTNGTGHHVTPARTLTPAAASESSRETSLDDLPWEDRLKVLQARASRESAA